MTNENIEEANKYPVEDLVELRDGCGTTKGLCKMLGIEPEEMAKKSYPEFIELLSAHPKVTINKDKVIAEYHEKLIQK